MEMESANNQRKTGLVTCGYHWIKALFRKFKFKTLEIAKKIKKVGEDDPRRIIHSLKVALALTLVSMFYYLRPLYDGFGSSGMWAVLTVVVIFEFSVGATLSKGLNRGFATLLAGALGIGAAYSADLIGGRGEPILLGFLVFLLAAASTFSRFFPHIKARYDYGVLIFILTFSLVAVSGYRVDKIIELAHQRLSTIIAGGAICMIISLFLCPVWAGEDLHNLVALNLEKLSSFLEGFGGEYFKFAEGGASPMISKYDKSFLQGYKSVLNSKSTEESLSNFAWWEPSHGRFGFRHPWKQYLKIGALSRQCAYKLEALSGYINSNNQVPSEFKRKIQEPCIQISSESGKALKELASTMKMMKPPSSAQVHLKKSKKAIDALKTVLEASSLGKSDLMEIIQVITVSSILIEITNCIEEIFDSINELSQLAKFKSLKPGSVPPEKPQVLPRTAAIKPVNDGDGDHVVIMVRGTCTDSPPPEKKNPQAPKLQEV